MNQLNLVVSSLKKAMSAEEKQGFSNTGVVGGFSAFLTGLLARLSNLPHKGDINLVRQIANSYPNWSPLRRREAFIELKIFAEELRDMVESKESLLVPELKVIEPQIEQQIDLKALPKETVKNEKPKLHIVSSKENAAQSTANKPLPLQFLKGVGPERARQLEQIGILTVKELFLHFPRRYEDRSLKKIADLRDGELATIKGKVVAGQITRSRVKVIKLSLESDGRLLYAVWFNQTFILKQYPVGTSVIVTGKVQWTKKTPELLVSDIEKASGQKVEKEIIAVYPESGRLTSKVFRSLIEGVQEQVDTLFPELLSEHDLKGFMKRSEAYKEIHNPSSFQALGRARERLVWEEILFLQLAVARLRKGIIKEDSPVLNGGEDLANRYFQSLPFQLTLAQKRVISEIFKDISSPKGMARLVQGDVGSGKTAVAMAAIIRTVGSGFQGAMMAPTEILAIQHFKTFDKVLGPLGVKVVCLLGSQTKTERDKILREIREGDAQVVVGTHALIQESVQFKALGLAVTDEQHRFGVKQRTLLQNKGTPHVLVLTATPIPRTLALTLYGDLQLSVLDEMPSGRKPIITKKVSERARPSLEKFLEEQIILGRQIYVVCPLVEESENFDLISATERYEQLQNRFGNRKVALLHGRMKGQEKEEIMEGFQKGDINILVATTVVEVGVNVPNASVMVIEGAERFGLAQLHQLRGRVGRGSEQSFCILISSTKDSKRLDVLCETNDGFRIAEEDLRLRGPGDLLGTKQHGLAQLKLADLSRDGKLVEQAYRMAQKVLSIPEKYQNLLDEIEEFFPRDKVGLH